MRDEWYADNRDLVKWGVLLQLAQMYDAGRIIQVAYYRPSSWESLEIDDEQYCIPGAVIDHFRNVRNISNLRAGPRIDVIDTPFSDRSAYTHEVPRVMAAGGNEPCIVFLDPDTGLEPRKPGLEHVLESELAVIWAQMRDDDVLVFYQHQTNRSGEPWIERKLAQFEHALGLPRGTAKLALGPTIARDVVFFFCQKGRPEPKVDAA